MVKEVKRKVKKVEVEVVELKVELPAEFFDNMDKAKAEVAKMRGYDISYGEYIVEAMEDLVKMVEDLSVKVTKAKDIISGLQEVPKEEKPLEPEPGTEVSETEVPAELYAHIIKDEDKHTMYQ